LARNFIAGFTCREIVSFGPQPFVEKCARGHMVFFDGAFVPATKTAKRVFAEKFRSSAV
jgi:hypothetical protein